MRQFLETIGIWYILCFSSCIERRNIKSTILVDIEENIDRMEVVNLSQYTDNIKYLPLESMDKIALIGLNNVDVSDNLILVNNGNICVLFDSTGKFISKIGTQGRGPGEYLGVTNMQFGKHQEIYLSYLYDLLEYNIDGSFKKKYTKALLTNYKYLLQTWYPVDDSLFLGRIPNNTGKIEYKAMLVDKLGNVNHYYRNYDLFNREREIGSFAEGFSHIYHFKGSLFYKDLYNDTLFSLNDKYALVPKYAFNLGKLKEPISEREKAGIGDMWNYIYLWNVFQTEDYLLIKCQFGNKFSAKRITPASSRLPGGAPIWINTNYILGVYDKHTGDLVFCKPSDTDNRLNTTGMFNDIDCGPKFFPQVMVNDSTMLMSVKAEELKEHVASDDFKNSIPKYPEKKKELEMLASNLSLFDNPILVYVTFNHK